MLIDTSRSIYFRIGVRLTPISGFGEQTKRTSNPITRSHTYLLRYPFWANEARDKVRATEMGSTRLRFWPVEGS